MARPSTYPSWATSTNYPAGSSDWSGQPCKVQPSAGKQAQGITPNTDQPAEEFNWLFNFIYLWFQWLLTIPTTASDAPQYVYQDAAGNNRTVFDHNGYDNHRRVDKNDDWSWLSATVSGAFGPAKMADNPAWTGALTANAALSVVAPSTTYPVQALGVNPGTANANSGVIYGTNVSVIPLAYTSHVFRYEFAMTSVGANNETWFMGLQNNAGALQVGNNALSACSFFKRSTDTNWQVYTNGLTGGPGTIVDTGVPPIANTIQKFCIELHGSSSPYGAKARFFIDDVKVAEITTTLPATDQSMREIMGASCTGVATATGVFGPRVATWNRLLAVSAV